MTSVFGASLSAKFGYSYEVFGGRLIRSRNCNVNLDELRWDRSELDCEPPQARGIPRNLQLDETVLCPVRAEAALFA